MFTFFSLLFVMEENGLIIELRLISKFMTSQTGQHVIIMHILSYILRSKDNQAMKFGQLIEYNVTLDHNIPQNLHFFIFNSTFLSVFIPFFTSFQVVFPTQFPMNYSCNIIVPSWNILCQLFTFTHNIKYCLSFLITESTKC